jgi:predicted double-glycine peptidase
MVLAYLGRDVTEFQVAKVLRSYSFGTPAPNVRYLESLDFSVTFGQMSLSRLRAYLQQGVPCIVFVQAADLPYAEVEGFHAVVVVGLGEHVVYITDKWMECVPVRGQSEQAEKAVRALMRSERCAARVDRVFLYPWYSCRHERTQAG